MTSTDKITALIVDDSFVLTQYLSINLPLADKRIQIAGVANSVEDAIKKIQEIQPDVITLDIEMPHTSGLDFLQKLPSDTAFGVILCSTLDISKEEANFFQADDFIRKPVNIDPRTQKRFLRNLASAVVREGKRYHKKKESANNILYSARTKSTAQPNRTKNNTPAISSELLSLLNVPDSIIENTIVVIGASTGGTETVLSILRKLPANFPATVITQHMPEGFTKMYADRLDSVCQMDVREAKNGDTLRPGLVLISPGGELQTRISKCGSSYITSCKPEEKYGGHRPSVDVLFNSAAENINKKNIIGVLLTGMGKDGAEGLLNLKNHGAYTIGQDQASCVVYGMPCAAYTIGAVCKQASYKDIPLLLVNHIRNIR